MGWPPATPLLECVANFSEGRDREVIRAIAGAIESVDGVAVLDVDSGASTHRTVVSFAGPPDALCEAAFRAVREAVARIDMRLHRGAHPRLGAADVCPLVPLRNVTLDEAADRARRLGERVGRELDLPVYLYGHAATSEVRRSLASVRRGGYEGLGRKLEDPAWRPDYGPARPRPVSGATIIGARDVLVAFNVNLASSSAVRARRIAADVRESGRPLRRGGRIVCDAEGRALRRPGTLTGVRAIGWYLDEFDRAQVSLNVTDVAAAPLHEVYGEVSRAARARGTRVTGSELVGLVPLAVLLAAGRFFLARDGADEASESETVAAAVRGLGLDELRPFEPRRKVLDYRLEDSAPSSSSSSSSSSSRSAGRST